MKHTLAHRWEAIVFSLFPLLGCSGAISPEAPSPRILFLSVDTTRPDALGFFGGAAETPHIDALLSESLVMARHHSCSGWTYPSMICAMSGRSALDMGFIIDKEHLISLPAEERLPSDLLSDEGWRTRLISTNTYVSPKTGFSKHYENYTDLFEGDAETVVDAALDTVAVWSETDEPWLLHAHFFDPHTPYAPPADYVDVSDLAPIDYDLDRNEEYSRMRWEWDALDEGLRALVLAHLERRYLGEYAYLDDALGRLLEAVDEDVAVVIMTDHGEQFWEHGDHGHAASLHREENSALAAIRWPDRAPGVWEQPTTHQDIWPTLFDWMRRPPMPTFTGEPLGQASDLRAIPLLRFKSHERFAGLVQGDAKLLLRWSVRGEEAPLLYDLGEDPGETRDVSAAQPQQVASLRAALTPTLERVRALTTSD